jgi:hypothetical protein
VIANGVDSVVALGTEVVDVVGVEVVAVEEEGDVVLRKVIKTGYQ